MPHPDWHFTLALGLLLAVALVGGLLAQAVRLPRVTAYLVVGLFLGPQVLNFISEHDLTNLDAVGKLAMALVLFNVGCHFTFVYLRRIIRRAFQFSAREIGLTFLLVTGGMLLFGQPWQAALLLGAMAIATAPATTILVLKENRSEGPLTNYATILVVLNNLAAVVAFELLLLSVHFLGGKLASPIHLELVRLLRDLIGSVGLGVLAGLVASYSCALLAQNRWFVLLIAIATLLLGASEALDMPYLLTFLAMGITVANASDQEEEIGAELDRFTGLLCVVFFVIHGAELKFRLLLEAGDNRLIYAALAYIGLRGAGKYLGPRLPGRADRDDPQVRRWLGATLQSQAGAAIALAAIAAHPETGLGELGQRLQLIILGSVVFFEIIGPILIQLAVRQAGEVPLSQAIRHRATTPLGEVRALVQRLLRAVGFDPWRNRPLKGITVEQVMRRNVKSIAASATFAEVIDHIEQSQDNCYPVVDDRGKLIGVIHYEHLRDALFDPKLASLVRALDLSMPCSQFLLGDEPLARAEQHLREGTDDCIFVVSRGPDPVLVGMLRRREALRFFAKRNAPQAYD